MFRSILLLSCSIVPLLLSCKVILASAQLEPCMDRIRIKNKVKCNNGIWTGKNVSTRGRERKSARRCTSVHVGNLFTLHRKP